MHEDERRIITYAEGDVTEVACPDQKGFAAELRHMEEFYGPAPPAFRVIGREGNLIYIYDERTDANPEPS